MEQSIASVLAQHNLQESLLILKDCQARGFDTFCMLRSFQCINVIQCVVWVEPKKFNLVIWDFGSSGSDSCFFFFRWIISLYPFYFLWLLFSPEAFDCKRKCWFDLAFRCWMADVCGLPYNAVMLGMPAEPQSQRLSGGCVAKLQSAQV